MFSFDNLLRPRPLWLNVYFTLMTVGIWIPIWVAASRRAASGGA